MQYQQRSRLGVHHLAAALRSRQPDLMDAIDLTARAYRCPGIVGQNIVEGVFRHPSPDGVVVVVAITFRGYAMHLVVWIAAPDEVRYASVLMDDSGPYDAEGWMRVLFSPSGLIEADGPVSHPMIDTISGWIAQVQDATDPD